MLKYFYEPEIQTWVSLAELCRREAAHHKNLHGYPTNRILALGNSFRFKQLSIRKWQKRFGRSIDFQALGTFLQMLYRKAENTSGLTIPFSTWTTALSQTCHCGRRMYKPLSVRWHHCPDCGVNTQHEFYSTFLVRFVKPVAVKGGKTEYHLNTNQVRKAWLAANSLLHTVFNRMQVTSNGRGGRLLPAGLGTCPGTKPVATGARDTVKSVGRKPVKNPDAVRNPQNQGSQIKVGSASSRTPSL